ncbi:MAG: glycosyltransferase family 9 protein [Planctomycetes bacterium]|nr:glycosyltransferase family 9 protein [Planctomycetota bacterium]
MLRPPRKPARILIVRLSAIGDCLNTLPALHALRRNFPSAHIAWLVEDKARDAVEGQPGLDEVLVFDRRRWRENWLRGGRAEVLRDLVGYAGRLREGRFDWVVDFQGNLKSGLSVFASRSPIRIGFSRDACREGSHLFTNVHVRPGPVRVHRIERNLGLLRGLGLAVGGGGPAFRIGPEAELRMDRWLAGALATGGRFVVLHPGTSAFGAYKRWPVESFARLGDLAWERLGLSAVVSWGPGEEGLARSVVDRMRAPGLVSCRTADLRELAALLARAAAFVGSDSAPLQLASLLGVPTVALFGPKDPVLHGPHGNPHEVLYKGVPCSPCLYRTCAFPDCMRLLQPADALAALARLAATPAGRCA